MARKNIHLPDGLLKQVAEIQQQHHMSSETQTIIRLLQIGIYVTQAPDRGEVIVKKSEGSEIELKFLL